VPGWVVSAVVQPQDVRTHPPVALQHSLHLLLVYLEKSLPAQSLLPLPALTSTLHYLFLQPETLLAVGLPQVLRPYAVNLEIFGKFIHVKAIFEFAVDYAFIGDPIEEAELGLLLFTCLFILEAMIGDAIAEGKGVIVEFMK
jgi:hypothetical protein